VEQCTEITDGVRCALVAGHRRSHRYPQSDEVVDGEIRANAYFDIRLDEIWRDAVAAIGKLDQLTRELGIPDTNHTLSKARMFLVNVRDAAERK
jgi:hypothetical protein